MRHMTRATRGRRVLTHAVVLTTALTLAAVGCASSAAAQQPGSVSGLVTDETGTAVVATISLAGEGGWATEIVADAGGRFAIGDVPAGRFQLTVTSPGFAPHTISGVIQSGERFDVPPIRLRVTVDAVTIDVTPTEVVAERQLQEQVQQRVLGVVPNFYVSFVPNAAPLNTAQKFRLSWKATIDPFQFAGVAVLAGVEQARNQFPGFGSGWSGYMKRYAAAYGAESTQRMFNRVIMPAIFRQDPRYFYKGEGTVRSRVLYALSRSVIRKGDNGHWQPNYSSVAGSFAAAGVSNFYYPEADRHGLRLTLQNVGIGLVFGAVGNVTQEFLWSRLTSRAAQHSRPTQ